MDFYLSLSLLSNSFLDRHCIGVSQMIDGQGEQEIMSCSGIGLKREKPACLFPAHFYKRCIVVNQCYAEAIVAVAELDSCHFLYPVEWVAEGIVSDTQPVFLRRIL